MISLNDICVPILFGTDELESDWSSRFRREAEDLNDKRHCDLTCTCSPGLDNSIAQESSMDQKSSQKQTVSMKSAFGFGAIALVVCLLIALGAAFYAYKSKAKENG